MIIDVTTGKIAATFPGEGNMIPTFDPMGRRIATSNVDGSISLWSWDGEQLAEISTWAAATGQVWPGHITSLGFSADGDQLVSGDIGNGVRVWDVTAGHEVKELDALDTRVGVYWLATAPSGGEIVAFFTPLNGIHLWRYGKDRDELLVKPGDGPAVASFSPDGRLIIASRAHANWSANNVLHAAINQGQKISVLDATSGTEVPGNRGQLAFCLLDARRPMYCGRG